MKNSLAALILLFIFFTGKAQDFASPSLAVGVGKVVYEKGKLDAEVIAELISTKQDEVKKELMKRWVLKATRGGSLAVQNFIAQNMEILLSEASEEVKKKELLRNAAELALVIGIAEFYMNELKGGNERLTSDQKAFLLNFMSHLDQKSKNIFVHNYFHSTEKSIQQAESSIKDGDNLGHLTKTEDAVKQIYFSQHKLIARDIVRTKAYHWFTNSYKQDNTDLITKKYKVVSSDFSSPQGDKQVKFLPKLQLLTQFKNQYIDASERKTDIVTSNHILIDLVYKVCVSHPRINDLGFFQRLDLSKDEFIARNKYTQFADDSDVKKAFKPIEIEITNRIDKLFSFFVPFQSILLTGKIDSSVSSLDNQLIKDLKLTYNNNRIPGSYSITSEEEEVLRNVSIIIGNSSFFSSIGDTVKTVDANPSEFSKLNDYTFYLKNKALPVVASLNAKTSGSLTETFINLESVVKNLEGYLSYKLGNDSIAKSIKDFESYTALINTISNLDKVETYDKIIKFLADVGNLYSDRGIGTIVNSFVNAYDKYAIVVKEENKLKIDVEAIAVDAFNRYGKNSKSDVSLYLTVGVNYATSPNYLKAPDKIDSAKYFTYASEKIGIKTRIVNFTKRRALLNYPRYNHLEKPKKNRYLDNSRPPLVNDIHLLFYGSGLLYKVQQLNSESSIFSKPIGGIALGVSFFNGLDLNIGYAAQFGNAKEYLFTAGFDVNFTEYLSGLRKKKSKQ